MHPDHVSSSRLTIEESLFPGISHRTQPKNPEAGGGRPPSESFHRILRIDLKISVNPEPNRADDFLNLTQRETTMLIDTLNRPAPEGAVVLFDGSSIDNWTKMDGAAPDWQISEGCIEIVPKTGDICTKELFSDHFLHLEFKLSDMPDKTGQAKSNSGVFLQGRYEIQVLDSSGWDIPGFGDCGSIYDQYAPLTNACEPALEWQTYDVIFRAPRCEGKVVKENARVTLFHNGVLILNNIELPGVTGAPTDTNIQLPGHLRLQDHGNIIWYRNIWAVHLNREGASEYTHRMSS